jgi:hypothetical protein
MLGNDTGSSTDIREATAADNDRLLRLASLTPMGGQISLRIDRYPDFFRLLNLRGPNKVFIAERDGEVIGSISSASVTARVNGNLETVRYLGDLKVNPRDRKSRLAGRLVLRMHEYLRATGADIIYCTAADGNEAVIPVFEGRLGLPRFERVGIFRVLQLVPSPFKETRKTRPVQQERISPDLIRIYNDYFSRYRFGPIFREDSFESARHLAVRCQGKIRAALSLVDTDGARQNVLIGLPLGLRIALFLLRAVPIVHLPRLNEPIRMLYIRAFGFEAGYEDAFHALIQKARNIAFEERYALLTIGLHEADPLIKLFARYPKFTFRSVGLVASLKNRRKDIDELLKGIAFEDYSLI